MRDVVSTKQRERERSAQRWAALCKKAAEARKRGGDGLQEFMASTEGQMALAFAAATYNFCARQRRIDSPANQRFLLGRYTAWKADGGRESDRPRRVEDELDVALVALANRAAPWELSDLTADLRGSRGVIERRITEYYEMGDRLLDEDSDLAEMQPGPSEGPGLPRRSWQPAPPSDEPERVEKIIQETTPTAPKMGG